MPDCSWIGNELGGAIADNDMERFFVIPDKLIRKSGRE